MATPDKINKIRLTSRAVTIHHIHKSIQIDSQMLQFDLIDSIINTQICFGTHYF